MGFMRRLFGVKPFELPHEDPDLERLLPAAVAGRPLERWSVRGEHAYTLGAHRLDARDAASIKESLEGMGLALDDVSMAFAGRATESDPPFIVQAWRFGDRPAEELPLDLAVAHKGIGGWKGVTLGDKRVSRGTPQMVDQTSSVRGRPYVVRSGPVHFSIVTDDEQWADEVCRQLPAPTEAG